MKLLLYEYACANLNDADLPASVRQEGRAMFDAVLEDANELIPEVEIITDFTALGIANVRPVDAALIIAPEFDGILENLAREARETGWKLLGPSPEAIHLTADKWLLYQHWKQHQVPTPATWLPSHPPMQAGPYLTKHRWGAGSVGVKTWQPGMASDDNSIIQVNIAGIPVSLAFLVDCNGRATPLLPAYQHISDDGTFQYRGGSLVQNPEHRERIIHLASSAIRDIPGLLGYVGVDALLCEAGDVVLEINPRLTTSYLGLRQATTNNLLGCMLACAMGKLPDLLWMRRTVLWDANGAINSVSGKKMRASSCNSTLDQF